MRCASSSKLYDGLFGTLVLILNWMWSVVWCGAIASAVRQWVMVLVVQCTSDDSEKWSGYTVFI